MKGLAALLGLLIGSPGVAQELVQAGTDTIEIRASKASGILAEIIYNNGASQGSDPGTYTLSIDGVVVDVQIEVHTDERLTVTPHDPGLIAVPVEADVPDGESITVDIMLPMF